MVFKIAYFYGDTAKTVIAKIKKWQNGKITYVDEESDKKKTIDEERIIYIYTFERKKKLDIPEEEYNQLSLFDILK